MGIDVLTAQPVLVLVEARDVVDGLVDQPRLTVSLIILRPAVTLNVVIPRRVQRVPLVAEIYITTCPSGGRNIH